MLNIATTTSSSDSHAGQRMTRAERRRQAERHMAAVHHVSTSGMRNLRAALDQFDPDLVADGLRSELAAAGLL
jgi:hypothetical protein